MQIRSEPVRTIVDIITLVIVGVAVGFTLWACPVENLKYASINVGTSIPPPPHMDMLPRPSGGGVIYMKEDIQINYDDQLGGRSPKGSDATTMINSSPTGNDSESAPSRCTSPSGSLAKFGPKVLPRPTP